MAGFTVDAQRRARELLFGFLTPEQARNYDKRGYFDIESFDGERKYRIRQNGTPQYISDEITVFQYGSKSYDVWNLYPGYSCCVHMARVPWDDYNLACAMLLSSEEGEKYFHQIANW